MNETFPSLQAEDLAIILSLASVTIFFIIYHFFVNSEKFSEKWTGEKGPVRKVVAQRLSGLIILGVIPISIALLVTRESPAYFGISFQNGSRTLLWALAASGVIVFLSFLNARKPSNLRMYPQIRVKHWTYSLLFWSNLTWVLYLLGYETLFRGILFFPLLHHLGLVAALSVNVAIYSLAHIPKGITEAIGAIPFGIVVCLAAYATGNIWFPFLVHSVMALSSEWFSLYFHPEMHLKKPA